MKTIKFISAGLLLITGILHIYLAVFESSHEQFAPTLIFGISYCLLGILIISEKRFAAWIGLILPLLPITGSLVRVDLRSTGLMTIVVLILDLAILISCLILVFRKRIDQLIEPDK